MSYSQFTLDEIELSFNVTITENVGIFNDIPEKDSSPFLQELLNYNGRKLKNKGNAIITV